MPNLTTSSAVDTFMGSANQAAMQTNLGLGTIATQNATNLALSGLSLTGSQATNELA